MSVGAGSRSRAGSRSVGGSTPPEPFDGERAADGGDGGKKIQS
jgi:hypothetical protein